MLSGKLVSRHADTRNDDSVALPSVCLSPVQLTQTAGERMRGLLGREPLHPGEALWIMPCNSVHSFFMGYPIDLVYLDRKQQVCKCVEAMAPWRFSACWRARSVLELPAGQIRALGIKIGWGFQWQDN